MPIPTPAEEAALVVATTRLTRNTAQTTVTHQGLPYIVDIRPTEANDEPLGFEAWVNGTFCGWNPTIEKARQAVRNYISLQTPHRGIPLP